MLHLLGVRPPSRLLIVRRDYPTVFDALRQSPDRWPAGTAVMWDRRRQDRRGRLEQVMIDRRRRQRRAEPDAMWYTHGFIVVETPAPPADAMLLRSLARYPGVRVDGVAPRDEARRELARPQAVTQLAQEMIDQQRPWFCAACSRALRRSGEVVFQGTRLVHAACWNETRY